MGDKPNLGDFYELTPPPNPINISLSFTCREYIGTEIRVDGKVCTDEAGVKEGMTIQAPGLGGYQPAVVGERREDGSYYATSTDRTTGFHLEFAKDDRRSWVASCLINLSAPVGVVTDPWVYSSAVQGVHLWSYSPVKGVSYVIAKMDDIIQLNITTGTAYKRSTPIGGEFADVEAAKAAAMAHYAEHSK